jgi:O-antigen ligase
VGLALLALLRPTREQLRAMAIIAAACAPPVLAGALLPEVRALEGSAASRETAGLLVLGILAVVALSAGVAVTRAARRAGPVGARELTARRARGPARAVAAVVAVGVAVVFGALTVQHHELVTDPVQTASTSRLASADSNRGDFWKVARGAFADEPLRGVGAGGFRVEWLRERPIPYPARDAHSLYLETPAELGVVGLALLVAFLGGIVACAVRARALDPTLAAGPIAVFGAWLVHAGLDWDWEMPGVTLPALVLAAVLVANAERSPQPPVEVPRREQHVPDPSPVGVEVGR